MYRITAKNRSGETYTLYDPRSPTLKVIDPVCDMSKNKAGLMKLTIPPKHPYFDKISKLNTILYLWQDSVLIFSGRVLNDEFDLYNTRKIEVEGDLAYLNDSIQPLKVYHGISVRDYLQVLLDIHNEQVEEDRRFVLGSVTVEDSNDNLYRQSNYENTMDAITDKLVDRLGGYLVIRYGEDGARYLDYLKEYGNVNSQPITHRTNLLDFVHSIRGEDVATVIIPLGAKLEDAENIGTVTPRVTIEDVNDGKNYLYDAEAVDKYGWIRKVVIHDDITLASNLLKAGYNDLEEYKYLIGEIKVSAVDLNLIDEEIERIKLGDVIPFENPYTNSTTSMLVSGIRLPVDAPGDTVYTLGIEYKTMTGDVLQNYRQYSQQLTQEIDYQVEMLSIQLGKYNTNASNSIKELSETVNGINDQVGDLNKTTSTLGSTLNFVTQRADVSGTHTAVAADTSSFSITYFANLGMCFIQAHIVLSEDLAANTALTVIAFDGTYKPDQMTALSAWYLYGTSAAYVRTDPDNSTQGAIRIKCGADIPAGSSIYIAGWWKLPAATTTSEE